jgi:predicted phosphodiesterase
MRIQIASDLHLEKWPPSLQQPLVRRADADVLVLAGDIARIDKVGAIFGMWPRPVLYVTGNHDVYYRNYREAILGAMRTLRGKPVRLLERTAVVLDGVRVLGTCLWTDFAINHKRGEAMDRADATNPDHFLIRAGANTPFTADDALDEHERSVEWLLRKLAMPFEGRTVVVTHHAPHRVSLGGAMRRPSDPVFASELGYLLRWVDLWIHGHVHRSSDYRLGRCRVVCNPAGFPRRTSEQNHSRVCSNRSFDPALVVEV